MTPRGRFLRTTAMVLVILIVAAAAIPSVRRAGLRRAGELLTASDTVQPFDLLTMDIESGLAGLLSLGDLYREHPRATVAVFTTQATAVDAELRRRAVVVPDLGRDTLIQLGIPGASIIDLPTGDGGTTESTAALAEWARAHPGQRVLVVVGPSHGRRYRRALRRVWPADRPDPRVVTTRYALFRADDWWQSRTTLREGLVELEKLALDYARHPW
jgi:hypothetical protein